MRTSPKNVERLAQALDKLDGKALKQVGKDATTHLNKTGNAAGKLHDNLEQINNVLRVQVIARTLNSIRDAMEGAAKSAIEFSTEIERIQTLADGGFGSNAQLTETVRKLADTYNLDLLDAAQGTLNAISNQTVKTTEDVRTLNAAAELAASTHTDFATAVDTLSTVMNSYGFEANRADEITSKLFRTIDLGRVNAQDLNAAMAKLAPIASQAGISLTEVLAALATLTNSGKSTPIAATEIQSAISGFIKPSEDLKRVLNELGFASSKQLFLARGMIGGFQTLHDVTGGSSEEIAALQRNVRALSGTLSLGGQRNEFFARSIDEIGNVASGVNREKALQVLNTDAQRVLDTFGDLKRSLTTDVGIPLLKATRQTLDLVGGADALANATKVASPFIGVAGTALAAYGARAALAAAGNAKLVGSFAVLGGPVGATIAAIAAVGLALDTIIDARYEDKINRVLKTREIAIDATVKAEAEHLRRIEELTSKQVAAAQEWLTDLEKTYQKQVDVARDADKTLLSNTEATLQRITNAREQMVRELERALETSKRLAADSRDRVVDLGLIQSDRKFDRDTRRLSDVQKAAALQSRASQLAREASDALVQAGRIGDRDAVQRALGLFGKAQQAGELAEDIAARVDNRRLEADAASTLNRITKQQIDAERTLQGIQAERQRLLEQERKAQEANVQTLKEQTKVVLENLNQFDKEGNLLSADKLAEQAAKRQEAFAKIAGSVLSQKDVSTADALGLIDLARDLRGELERQPIKLQFEVEEAARKVRETVERVIAETRAQIPLIGGLEGLLGRELKSPAEVSQGISDIAAQKLELERQLSAQRVLNAEIQANRNAIGDFDESLETVGMKAARLFTVGMHNKEAPLLAAAREELVKLSQQQTITDEQLTNLFQKLQTIRDVGNFDGWINNPVTEQEFDTVLQSFSKLIELKKDLEERVKAPAADELQTKIETINGILGQTPDLNKPFQGAASAAARMVVPTGQIASNMIAAAKAAAELAKVQIAASEERTAAFGRVQHLAAGGVRRRGSDFIPALLSRGETVINAASTRRFFPQLAAINAGVVPSFREHGGTTINNTIGDIHVNGSHDAENTARVVIDRIRRELRRGTKTF